MILIEKGGIYTRVTESKYNKQYKFAGYRIVEEDKAYDLDNMSYQELQALYSTKFDDSPVGQTKKDILEKLREVI